MENHETISKYAMEFICTRLDKINRRVIVALMITIVLLFASNLAWLWAWMQYDYESTETIYTQDGQGTNIIGDKNEVQQYVPDIEDIDEEEEAEERQ